MDLAGVFERLERTVAVCGSPDATQSELRDALVATTAVQGFIAARRAELVRTLAERPGSFAEATIAETSGCSLGQASKETERAITLDSATALAEALSDGTITPGHVDVITRATRGLEPARAASLLADPTLAGAASGATIAQFDAIVKRKAKALDRSEGEERFERQRRAARLTSWTDGDGMWNLRGRFDPRVGAALARKITAATSTRFSESTPDTAPSNPVERVQHLEALALAGLVLGDGNTGIRPGPPLVVVDATQTDGADGPIVDWGIPVELPRSVLVDVFDENDPDVVIVANGVVLHAAGRLDLGRASRLANRAQRRALAGLYSTCAVPGCSVHIDRCRLHHVRHWEHGGRTDLANLLPVCRHHHSRLHDENWSLTLTTDRRLTIVTADGTTMTTGPPSRGSP